MLYSMVRYVGRRNVDYKIGRKPTLRATNFFFYFGKVNSPNQFFFQESEIRDVKPFKPKMNRFFIHLGSYKKKKVHRPPQNTIKNFDFLSKAQLPPDFFSGKSEALQSVRKSPKESHFTTKINKSENETFLVIFKHCDNTLFLRLAAGFLLVSKKILHLSFLFFLSSFSAKNS